MAAAAIAVAWGGRTPAVKKAELRAVRLKRDMQDSYMKLAGAPYRAGAVYW